MRWFFPLLALFFVACETSEPPIVPDDMSGLNLSEFNDMCRDIGNLPRHRTAAMNLADKHDGQQGGITFTGSSTISIWGTLRSDFPDFEVRNMGIGGSTLADICVYSEELIFLNTPAITVLYTGDNDPTREKFDSFRVKIDCFIRNYLHRLPDSKLVLLSVKPSPARETYWGFYGKVNNFYEEAIHYDDDRVFYVDIWEGMLGQDYFKADGVHLNRDGYVYITSQLQPLLEILVARNP